MTVAQALEELEARGNDAMRTYNAKHGAGKKQFGVPLGDIRKVAKKIKVDHALGLALWKTGNQDARFLAALVMDPKALSADALDRLVRSITWARVADWLLAYVVRKHPDKEVLRTRWMAADDRWAARAGWDLTAERVGTSAGGLDLGALLDRIDAELGRAAPEVQWTMNFALIGIGVHHAKHRKRAIAIGEKHGVYRDYPTSKGCTSPFAPIAIPAMAKRKG